MPNSGHDVSIEKSYMLLGATAALQLKLNVLFEFEVPLRHHFQRKTG